MDGAYLRKKGNCFQSLTTFTKTLHHRLLLIYSSLAYNIQYIKYKYQLTNEKIFDRVLNTSVAPGNFQLGRPDTKWCLGPSQHVFIFAESLAKYEIHLCDTAINTTGYKVLINTSKRYHLHFNDHVNPTTYTA